MNRPSLPEILKHGESYYSLVIGVAKRAREIVEEANEQGVACCEKPVSEAVKEFADGKYQLLEPSEIGQDHV